MVNDNKLGEQQPNNSQLSRPRVRDDPRWGCDGDQHPGSGFELRARIFQEAKKRLIATHPKLEIALTPLRNLNLVFSNEIIYLTQNPSPAMLSSCFSCHAERRA